MMENKQNILEFFLSQSFRCNFESSRLKSIFIHNYYFYWRQKNYAYLCFSLNTESI